VVATQEAINIGMAVPLEFTTVERISEYELSPWKARTNKVYGGDFLIPYY